MIANGHWPFLTDSTQPLPFNDRRQAAVPQPCPDAVALCVHGTWQMRQRIAAGEEAPMLWTVFVLLLIMWLLGVATSYTLGGFIHILLLLAIASVLIRIIQGRSPV